MPSAATDTRALSELSLVEAMTFVVPNLIRACTPSVLPTQRLPPDLIQSDISVSFDDLGSPVSGTNHFETINTTVAKYYKARRAWSLVNGSTGANWVIARWLSYRIPHDQIVLIGRGSHVSVPQSLTDFRVRWEYLDADYVPEYEAVLPPSPEAVAKAIQGRTDVGAVWANGPSYEGVALDTAGIHRVLGGDERTILLIVDEAWGSHFPAHESTEQWCAASQSADVFNSSTHKQAGGLQGTAVLLTGHGPRVTDEEIGASVRSMSTTSPSYLLLASIESVYTALAEERGNGSPSVSRLLVGAARLRSQIQLRLAHLRVTDFALDMSSRADIVGVDPLKVTIGVRSLRASGIELGALLYERGVIAEKTSLNAVTFLVTYQMADDDTIDLLAARFADAIEASGGASGSDRTLMDNPFAMGIAPARMSPIEAARCAAAEEVLVRLDETVGRVALERLAAYPPGVPVIIEGQSITHQQVDFIQAVVDVGGHLLANRSGGQHHHGDPVMINVQR